MKILTLITMVFLCSCSFTVKSEINPGGAQKHELNLVVAPIVNVEKSQYVTKDEVIEHQKFVGTAPQRQDTER